MRGPSQATARYWMLMVAGAYIVIVGLLEAAKTIGALDFVVAEEAVRAATTLASLSVGAIIGLYLAARPRQN